MYIVHLKCFQVFFCKVFSKLQPGGVYLYTNMYCNFCTSVAVKNFVKNSNEKVLNEDMSIYWYDIIGLQV